MLVLPAVLWALRTFWSVSMRTFFDRCANPAFVASATGGARRRCPIGRLFNFQGSREKLPLTDLEKKAVLYPLFGKSSFTCSDWEGSKLTPCGKIFPNVLSLIWTKGTEMDTHFCAREKKFLHLFRPGEADIQPLFEKIIFWGQNTDFTPTFVSVRKSPLTCSDWEKPFSNPRCKKNFCLLLIRTGKGQSTSHF